MTSDEQIEDMVTAGEDIASAIKSLKLTARVVVEPAPVVMPDIVVQSATPQVNVQPAPVHIERAQPVAFDVEITERDPQGYLKRFTITPRKV